MSLLVLEEVSLSYGAQVVLKDVSFRIGERERIGLVGPNGSGKSTLLRVMLEEQKPDKGAVRRANRCRIGHLSQDVMELGGGPLLETVLNQVPGRVEALEGLEAVCQALEKATDTEEQMRLAQELAERTDEVTDLDTFFSERVALRILQGLGFPDSDMDRPISELSGGWKMRASLAGLLFQKPDILFLDEPTNHLDLDTVIWLDAFLKELPSALVLICHDRGFLNRHIERVLTFEPEGLRSYTGNYERYLLLRAEEEEVLGARQKNRERELKRAEKFVERFKAKATKARQASSRAKRAERLHEEIEADRPVAPRRQLKFSFPEVPRSGRDVVRMEGVGKAYGDHELYKGITHGIYQGDRIGIVGANGAGKTTLLKILANELKVTRGEVRFGTGVKMGYYAQHHNELLTESRTVLEEVWRLSPGLNESQVRGICGAFLFSRDEVDKVIGVLSGGERARVLLARLLVSPGNLLLMDEPTNHLDVAAADALAEALQRYGGTLVFVSHNITFVNQLATKIWDIRDGDLHEFPGTLTEYLDHREAQKLAAEAAPPKQVAKPQAPAPKKPKQEKKKPKPPPPAVPKRPADPELEKEIELLTMELDGVKEDLADPEIAGDVTRFNELYDDYRTLEAKMAELKTRRDAPPPPDGMKRRTSRRRNRR